MYKSVLLCISSVLILALAFSVGSLSAQIITGEITGTVTDQSGAAVPGAQVSAVCTATNATRAITTTETGSYRLTNLPVCLHKVTVSIQGFKTEVRQAEVAAGIVLKVDFQLQVGQKSETVTVEAVAPLVDYSPGVTNEVDTKAIVDLPTEGRDFKSILALTPGVQRAPGGGFLDVSVSGQRSTTNNYLVDGMPNNDRFYGSEAVGQPGLLGVPAALLGNDSIQEFSVQQLPSAEYGMKGGAAINVVLKSGSNGFHGTAFYFGDYDWLNAKNFFSTTTTPYHNHNFGGTLSGPIIKDRTFFFVNVEAQRNKSLAPYQILVPTQGDLFAALANFADPTQNVNNLPINPAGLALLKYYPCSNGAGGLVPCTPANANQAVKPGGFNQTVLLPDINTLPGSFIVKIDHKMNEKMNLSGRYLYADSRQSGPSFGYTIPPATGSGLGADGFNSIVPTRVQLAGATWTYSISANKILDARFNWNRYSQILDPNNKINPRSLGIDTGPLNPADFGVPVVYASSITAGYIGGVFGYPLSTRPTQNYDFSSHFTWTKGRHTFKMGGNYDYASTYSLRNRARSALSSFQADFPTFITQLLLGRVDEAVRSFGDTSRHLYQPSMGLFFQDEWKVSPRVTVNYGLRWEINGAMGDADKNASNFFPCAPPEPTVCAPSGFPNGLVQLQQGFSRLYNLDLRDFGPRAGLAWDVFGNGKTSLRIGYSMTYDVANFAAISAPYSFHGARAGAFTNPDLGVFSVTVDGGATTTNVTTNDVLFESPATNPNTCYNGTNAGSADWICFGPQPGSGLAGTCLTNATVGCFPVYGPNPTATPPFNIFGTVPNLRTPRIQYYSLTLQHQLFRNNVLSVGYFGSHGTDMFLSRDLNLRPIGCFTAAAGQLKTGPCARPFDSVFQDSTGTPLYKDVIQLTNDGFSRYNALQVTYRQRDWRGLNSIVNFTWSNCIDTNSVNRGGGGAQLPIRENPYAPASNIGPCDTDVRRNFNTGITYDFPKVSSLGRFGSGWQIGSVATYLTGRPFTVLVSTSRDNSGQDRSYQRPDCLAKPTYQYSDPNADIITNAGAVFGLPAPGTIGTCGRNAFRGPQFVQWDANLNKVTKINERLSIQLRWEVFNVLNHPNFNSSPSSTDRNLSSGSAFGSISQTPDVSSGNPFLSQGGPRAMQLGLKLIF